MLSKIRIMVADLRREIEARAKEAEKPLYEAMRNAAEAFVEEAAKRAAVGNPLDLDFADAFKGLVIEAAANRYPNDKDAVKKAFVLLGKSATVKARNHWATYEREAARLNELRADLGLPFEVSEPSGAPTNGASASAP